MSVGRHGCGGYIPSSMILVLKWYYICIAKLVHPLHYTRCYLPSHSHGTEAPIRGWVHSSSSASRASIWWADAPIWLVSPLPLVVLSVCHVLLLLRMPSCLLLLPVSRPATPPHALLPLTAACVTSCYSPACPAACVTSCYSPTCPPASYCCLCHVLLLPRMPSFVLPCNPKSYKKLTTLANGLSI